MTDAGGSSTGEHRSVPGRRAGRALMLLMLPFVVVGAALTVSLYGAFLGLPLLLVSWMAFRAGRRASRDPEDLATLKRLARDAAVAGALLGAVIVITVIYGWDDLDSVIEFACLVVALAWTAAIWWVAADALRAARSP